MHDSLPLSTPITARSVDDRGWELFLGFEIDRPGHFFSDGFAITYRMDGRAYHYVLQSQLVVCTPRSVRTDGNCPAP